MLFNFEQLNNLNKTLINQGYNNFDLNVAKTVSEVNDNLKAAKISRILIKYCNISLLENIEDMYANKETPTFEDLIKVSGFDLFKECLRF